MQPGSQRQPSQPELGGGLQRLLWVGGGAVKGGHAGCWRGGWPVAAPSLFSSVFQASFQGSAQA